MEVNLSQFINSIKDVKKNYTKYDGWEQNQADDAAKREHLSKTLELPKDKVELTEAKAKNVIRAAEILDKKSEDNCENTEKGDEIHILIITNKNQKTIYEVRDLCEKLGLDRAMAFDGGSSTSMNYKKSLEVVSTHDAGGRMLKSFLVVNGN